MFEFKGTIPLFPASTQPELVGWERFPTLTTNNNSAALDHVTSARSSPTQSPREEAPVATTDYFLLVFRETSHREEAKTVLFIVSIDLKYQHRLLYLDGHHDIFQATVSPDLKVVCFCSTSPFCSAQERATTTIVKNDDKEEDVMPVEKSTGLVDVSFSVPVEYHDAFEVVFMKSLQSPLPRATATASMRMAFQSGVLMLPSPISTTNTENDRAGTACEPPLTKEELVASVKVTAAILALCSRPLAKALCKDCEKEHGLLSPSEYSQVVLDEDTLDPFDTMALAGTGYLLLHQNEAGKQEDQETTKKRIAFGPYETLQQKGITIAEEDKESANRTMKLLGYVVIFIAVNQKPCFSVGFTRPRRLYLCEVGATHPVPEPILESSSEITGHFVLHGSICACDDADERISPTGSKKSSLKSPPIITKSTYRLLTFSKTSCYLTKVDASFTYDEKWRQTVREFSSPIFMASGINSTVKFHLSKSSSDILSSFFPRKIFWYQWDPIHQVVTYICGRSAECADLVMWDIHKDGEVKRLLHQCLSPSPKITKNAHLVYFPLSSGTSWFPAAPSWCVGHSATPLYFNFQLLRVEHEPSSPPMPCYGWALCQQVIPRSTFSKREVLEKIEVHILLLTTKRGTSFTLRIPQIGKMGAAVHHHSINPFQEGDQADNDENHHRCAPPMHWRVWFVHIKGLIAVILPYFCIHFIDVAHPEQSPQYLFWTEFPTPPGIPDAGACALIHIPAYLPNGRILFFPEVSTGTEESLCLYQLKVSYQGLWSWILDHQYAHSSLPKELILPAREVERAFHVLVSHLHEGTSPQQVMDIEGLQKFITIRNATLPYEYTLDFLLGVAYSLFKGKYCPARIPTDGDPFRHPSMGIRKQQQAGIPGATQCIPFFIHRLQYDHYFPAANFLHELGVFSQQPCYERNLILTNSDNSSTSTLENLQNSLKMKLSENIGFWKNLVAHSDHSEIASFYTECLIKALQQLWTAIQETRKVGAVQNTIQLEWSLQDIATIVRVPFTGAIMQQFSCHIQRWRPTYYEQFVVQKRCVQVQSSSLLEHTIGEENADDEIETALIAELIARIKFDEPAGSGSYGKTYKVLLESASRLYAVKWVTWSCSEDASEVMKEHQLLKSCLGHPNVVKVEGAKFSDRQAFIAMEWMEGGSVQDCLDRGQTFSEERILQIAIDVLEALVYMHREKHLIHRDIKPGNILLTKSASTTTVNNGEREVAKLGDFGMAKSAGISGGSSKAGTECYLAPECFIECKKDQRSMEFTDKSDIWALAVTLRQIGFGHAFPWMKLEEEIGASWEKMSSVDFHMLLMGDNDRLIDFPAALSAEFLAILVSCFDWDPNGRPSGKELLQQFKALQISRQSTKKKEEA